jgi:hypothetical protein
VQEIREVSEYHKIQSLFMRDMEKPKKPLILGDWATPEFEYLADSRWEFTEKVDGTNTRVVYEAAFGTVTFGGRTESAQMPTLLLKNLQAEFDFEKMARVFPHATTVVLYGEGYGKGIQKVGSLYGDHQSFVLFDVLVDGWWLRRPDVNDVAEQFGIKSVPVIGAGTLMDAVELARAGFKSDWGDFNAEGIVARPSVELRSRGGERIIAKIKTRDFQ